MIACVISTSCFEICRTGSIISFGSIDKGYFCFIHNGLLFALALKRASGFNSATALGRRRLSAFGKVERNFVL